MMKNIKLILALIVSISLIFTLSSCDLFGASNDGEGEGNSESGLLTFKEYLELSIDDQMAYYNTFADFDAFSAWYNVAKAEYELLYGPIGGTPDDGDGDINIDLGGDNNENEDGPSGSIGVGDKLPEDEDTEGGNPEDNPPADGDGDNTDDGNGNEGDKPSDTEGGEGDNSGDKPTDGDNTDGGNGNEGDKPSDTEGSEGDNPGDKPTDGDNTDDGNGNEGDKPSDTEDGEGDNTGDKPADGDNPGDKPADGDGTDDDGTTLLTWEEYISLSTQEQIDYFNSFEDITAFQEWYNAAWEAYQEANKGEDIPDDGNIDLGGK